MCSTALREVMLLKALSHPNVMSLECIHTLPAELSLCLAFPYAETGAPGRSGRPRECLWPRAHPCASAALWPPQAGSPLLCPAPELPPHGTRQ